MKNLSIYSKVTLFVWNLEMLTITKTKNEKRTQGPWFLIFYFSNNNSNFYMLKFQKRIKQLENSVKTDNLVEALQLFKITSLFTKM